MKVGVLALQGDYPEHRLALDELLPPESVVAVRRPSDLADLAAFVLPGGESTTISQLLQMSGLWEPLGARLRSGLPVLATCAGLILVSQRLEPSPSGRDPPTLGLLDILVRRNEYGAQVDSFEAPVELDGSAGAPFPGVFIRAPRIVSVGPDAQPFARRGSEIVAVRNSTVWGLTFHPELSHDPRILEAFLASVRVGADQKKNSKSTRAAKRTAPTATATR
jgi:5'-phosphate synthase pdxT subunit